MTTRTARTAFTSSTTSTMTKKNRAAVQQHLITVFTAQTMLRRQGHCLVERDQTKLCGITVYRIRDHHALEVLEVGLRAKLALDQQ